MRKAGGYSIISGPLMPGQAVEADTFTCAHCNRVRFLPARQEPEFRCKSCFGYICEGCANKDCLPLEEQLRMMESPKYRPRRVFKMSGR